MDNNQLPLAADQEQQAEASSSSSKPPRKLKAPRASTSNKNRTTRSPSPYRSRPGQSTTEFVNEFWQHTVTTAEELKDDFKHQALPLARIKKVMKSDPEVKMISSEVTIIFEKACQIFIQELTARSHLVSLSSKRRTLSRPDVAQAISKSDMFDFLIDIVPRMPSSTSTSHSNGTNGTSTLGGGGGEGSRKRSSRKRKQRSDDEDDSEGDEEEDEEEEDVGAQGQGGSGEGDPYVIHVPSEHVMAEQAAAQHAQAQGNGINWPGGGFDYSNVGHANFFNTGPGGPHQ